MGIQVVTTSGSGVALSNAVRARYIADYLEGAMPERLYDQLASPIAKDMSRVAEGSSVQVNFLSSMQPGTSAISEVVDITPQTLTDATATLTPTSRAEGLKASELLMLQEYTGYGAKQFKRIGENMMETVEILARDAATQGSWVERNAATRNVLDAGATGHRADDAVFMDISGALSTMKVPGYKDPKNGSTTHLAITHPHVFHDILQSGNVVAVGQYQNQSILFNHELGSLSGFRLVVSPWAKVFMGAGADNAKVVDTVCANAISPLDKVFTISSTSSVEYGKYLVVGTEETANTHYPKNEQIKYVSDSAKVITLIGQGSNGGFRYSHDASTAVRNADSAYTIVVGGPESLAKVYQPDVGVFGQIIGPRRRGSADQWVELTWKWYGGYARLRENGILRQEVSVSAEE